MLSTNTIGLPCGHRGRVVVGLDALDDDQVTVQMLLSEREDLLVGGQVVEPAAVPVPTADPRNVPKDLPLPKSRWPTRSHRPVPSRSWCSRAPRGPELAPILWETQALADLSLAEQPEVLS